LNAFISSPIGTKDNKKYDYTRISTCSINIPQVEPTKTGKENTCLSPYLNENVTKMNQKVNLG
jgi:hypothetical protein